MQRIPSSEAPSCGARAGRVGHAREVTAAVVRVGALIGAVLMTFPTSAQPQELERGIRQPWSLYVFVSTNMPRQALVALAREASAAHATMVFRGFQSGGFDLGGEQRLVAELNEECCHVSAAGGAGGNPRAGTQALVPAWLVDPALYHRFGVDLVPTFVLAANGATGAQSFSKVTGDMALASALKYFAQRSAITTIRQEASATYQAAFGGRQ